MEDLFTTDPEGAAWSTLGFQEAFASEEGDGDLLAFVGNGICLMQLQLVERVLPGAVIKERMAARAASLAEKLDRPLSRAEWATLRDEAELDLLPKAFLRRTLIPVIVSTRSGYVAVCTASESRADRVLGILTLAGIRLTRVETASDVTDFMQTLATDGRVSVETAAFDPLSDAKLVGTGKRTITVKDLDIESGTVQTLLAEGYRVKQLKMAFGNDVVDPEGGYLEDEASFRLTDKLALKGFKPSKSFIDENLQVDADKKADAVSYTLTVGSLIDNVIAAIVTACGGIKGSDDEL